MVTLEGQLRGAISTI